MDSNTAKCQEAVFSNEFSDFIVEYNGDIETLKNTYQPDCIQVINNRYAVLHFRITDRMRLSINQIGYRSFPKCFGLMDSSNMEQSGILRIQRQPSLNLRGQGVLIGMIDTGAGVKKGGICYE